MKYKGVNNIKHITYYFEDLLIDIDNNFILVFKSFHIKSKQFYISIGQLYSFEFLIIIKN